jgi:hypothetical protein
MDARSQVNNRLTMLIAGEFGPGDRLGDGGIDPLGVLGQVVEEVSAHCQTEGGRLRLLTAAGLGAVQAAAAQWASQLALDLHLLSPGQPQDLTAQQARAERQVWLGADAEALATQAPLELCDEIGLGFADAVLVAWRGPVPGRPCRTARLVVAAALAMKPVVWVDELGAIRVLNMHALSAVQHNLLLTAQPSGQMLQACFSKPCAAAVLRPWLSEVFPKVPGDAATAADPDALQSAASSHAGRVHNVMLALVQGKLGKAWKALGARPITAYRGPTWAGAEDLIAPTVELDQAFDRADVEAAVAAGKYRSSVWLSSAASTLAVFAAVAGAIDLWFGTGGAAWAVLEVLLVSLIIFLLWRVRRKDWHTRWISSRFVAEQLRYARMGLPVLALSRPLFEPYRCLMRDASGKPRLGVLSAEVLQLQKCITGLGLPSLPAGGPLVLASESALERQRDYVLAVIRDQIAYHHRVHHDQHVAAHVLHTLTVVLFCLTGAAVLGHFVLHAKWLLIFTAFFPALAAGIHGLGTSLEISRIAEQSKTTASELSDLAQAVEMASDSEDRPWDRWVQLRELTRMAAELMSDENGQWQKLVNHQKPQLPA